MALAGPIYKAIRLSYQPLELIVVHQVAFNDVHVIYETAFFKVPCCLTPLI